MWGHLRSKGVKSHFKVIFRNNKAQCNLVTLFGLLNGRFVCCGSFVIKRKQGLSMDKAEEASGIVVDLPPKKLEGFGLELLLKKVAAYTKKQFHLAADGDMQVKTVTIFRHHHPSPKFLSPISVTNIRHQYFCHHLIALSYFGHLYMNTSL